MEAALLDTDMFSEDLKGRNPQVMSCARQYFAEHHRFAFSMFTVYELMRGLKLRRALRQQAEFQRLLSTSDVFPVSTSVLLRAADLWVLGRRAGHPHNDADLLIAASALEAGRELVTGNSDHFS